MRRQIHTSLTHVSDVELKCRCGNVATFWLETHKMDHCTDEPTIGGFKCLVCLRASLRAVDSVATEGMKCITCGLVVSTPSDLLVRVSPIGP